MHQLQYHDNLAFRGEYRIIGVNFWPEIKAAVEHLRKLELRQVEPVTEAEARRILAEACPCWDLEHRRGICPMGHSHKNEDHEGRNTVLTSLKKSVIDQMVGNASPTNLLITRVAAGTNATATNLASTTLGAETYRDVPTYLAATSSTQLQCFWYYGPGVANSGSNLQEWGIFGGGATGTANSGVMLARFLQQFTKNVGTAANGQYTFNAT